MNLPEFRVYKTKLAGTPYWTHTIYLADGRQVHAQLSPYGEGEAADRVRAFLEPQPLVSRVISFNNRRPGRPRKGETWRNDDKPEGDE